jgi:hypothetical protein
MRSHINKAGVKVTAKLTLHTLRKSFAQNYANGWTSSATLKALMGHSSITTTEQYYLLRSDENDRAATQRYESLLAGATCVGLAYEPSGNKEDTSLPEIPSQQTLSGKEVSS